MASNFPGAADNLAANKTDSTTTASNDHAGHHNALGDGVNAVQSTIHQSIFKLQPVKFATTAALPAVTYANGTSGVGATLTANANGVMAAIDGVTPVAADRMLVKNQAATEQNGIYVVTSIGAAGAPFVLTRAGDGDTSAKLADAQVHIEQGTNNADTQWLQSSTAPVIGNSTTGRIYWRRALPIYGHGNPRPPWAVGADTTQVLMETMPRFAATAALTLPTAATHTLWGGIVLGAGKVATNLNFVYTTAAATITTFSVTLVRLSDRQVLASSTHSATAWAAAPAVKTVAFSAAYTAIEDTPVYVGIASAWTTAAIVPASPAFPSATGLTARAPILVGTTTAPTSGTAPAVGATMAAITATVGGIPYIWIT